MPFGCQFEIKMSLLVVEYSFPLYKEQRVGVSCNSKFSIDLSIFQSLLFKNILQMALSQVLILFLLLTAIFSQQRSVKDLNQNWQMKILSGPPNFQPLKSKTYHTSIPTTVHLDLLSAGDIPDPFLKQNFPLVKWVSDCNYSYTLNFTVSDKIYMYPLQKLVFEGIDTYSEIKLNDKTILETANAFRQYFTYVQGLLKPGVNKLQVVIRSTNNADNAGQQTNSMPFAYAHTRKPGYQYSWDWAPYLNTLGIWKKVYLESFKEVKIDYVWARTRSISKQKAIINFAIALQLFTTKLQGYYILILQNGTQVANFSADQINIYHDVIVQNPILWWPHGIGKPHIYDFTAQLFKVQGKLLVDQRNISYGIRTVSLDLSAKKFQVVVNGYPIYCKGANYVPPDMFYPRLQNSAYKPGNTIQNLLNDAVDSNFNMLRVWGGGQYESDHFFELASRLGIMLFYDFMFSDTIYPSSEDFLLNVQEEVKQQVRRARNYPALTLWSGNNQILQGIQDWGWGQQKFRQDYRKLFEVLIPKIIEHQSPYIPYIPSSPIYGVGNYGLQRGGDVHYWGVWAGGSPFETYQNNIGSFNSEFGTQALPVWQTIIQTMSTKPSYQVGAVSIHERHNSRFNTLKNYISQYMKTSLNFEMQTYQSGLLQAYAIELAIIAQRVSKPKSAGTLYWQFNDAWPAISWSSIDYLGRWKPLQFMAKRLYPDVAIYTLNNKIYVVSDKIYPINALAIIQFFNLNGKLLHRIQKEVSLQANQVSAIYQINDKDYRDSKKEECAIYAEIIAGKSQVMSNTFFNAHFKNLKLYPAEIEVEYNEQFNQITIQAKSPIVKNLYISHKETYISTTNNYFDLVPGHPVKVIIKNKEGLAALKSGLVFRSYREVYTPDSSVEVNVK